MPNKLPLVSRVNRYPFVENTARNRRTRSRFAHDKAFFFVGHICTAARAANGAQILGKDASPKFNGVSMTAQMVKKGGNQQERVGVPSGMSADSLEREEEERRRVIDVVYEPDAFDSIEGADKLNREIYDAREKKLLCAGWIAPR